MTNKKILCRILNRKISREDINSDLNSLDKQEWKNLLTECNMQGVKPLVYSKLKYFIEEGCVPAFIQEDLREAHLRSAQKNTLILHYAGILLNAINAQNIPVIGLKGVYLLDNIYTNIAARTFGDIDIMVRKSDLQRVINILKSLGYEMKTYFAVGDENPDIKHVPPMINRQGLPVEIHWTILGEDQPFAIDVAGLWERAVPVKIAGVDVLSLSPEDLLLHLCLHLGYQHHLSLGLRGLYDISKVLHNNDKLLDWQKMVSIARKWGVDRVVWLTLSLAQDLLYAEIPWQVLSDLQPTEIEPWVLPSAQEILLGKQPGRLPMTPDLAALALEKGFFERVRLMFSRVFLPKLTLARLYGVPPTSLRIYGCYFRRIRELLSFYGPSVKRVLKKEPDLIAGAKDQQSVGNLMNWLSGD